MPATIPFVPTFYDFISFNRFYGCTLQLQTHTIHKQHTIHISDVAADYFANFYGHPNQSDTIHPVTLMLMLYGARAEQCTSTRVESTRVYLGMCAHTSLCHCINISEIQQKLPLARCTRIDCGKSSGWEKKKLARCSSIRNITRIE